MSPSRDIGWRDRVDRLRGAAAGMANRIQDFGLFRLKLFPGRRRRRAFEFILRERLWENNESTSGVGSTLEATRDVREWLPGLCKDLRISTLVDIPCGDFSWMSRLDLPIDNYVGGDIVHELVERNREKYQRHSRIFMEIDLASTLPPDGDMILVRDCLVHLPNKDAEKCLRNILRSRIPYLLATQYSCVRENIPCQVGEWRPVNLQRSPFNLPPPERVFRDVDFPGEPMREKKELGLWNLDRIRALGN